MGHFLFPLLKLHHSPAKNPLTSLLLYFLLCRAQLCRLLLVSLAHTLETSKVGDTSWSHLKQKRVETKPSFFGGAQTVQQLQGAAAFSCSDHGIKNTIHS